MLHVGARNGLASKDLHATTLVNEAIYKRLKLNIWSYGTP